MNLVLALILLVAVNLLISLTLAVFYVKKIEDLKTIEKGIIKLLNKRSIPNKVLPFNRQSYNPKGRDK